MQNAQISDALQKPTSPRDGLPGSLSRPCEASRARNDKLYASGLGIMLLTDTALPDRLGAAIHHHPHLRGRKLSVLSDSRRVILEGVVTSYYQKQMAQEAIRRIDGVRWIDNRLQVLPT